VGLGKVGTRKGKTRTRKGKTTRGEEEEL